MKEINGRVYTHNTRSGLYARIIDSDIKHDIYPICAVILGVDGREHQKSYTSTLQYRAVGVDENDLIPLKKYEHIKKDEPVICRETRGCKWMKCHFAEEVNGHGLCFTNGKTSFTTNGDTESWYDIYSIPEFKEKFPEEAERMGL